ncbi:MAG: DUF3634 family protein [Chromatiales bacterium]|jgi:hypothetical protein
MDVVFTLVLVAVLVAMLAGRVYTQTLFVLDIGDQGHVRVVKGTPPSGYRDACEDVARLNRLDRGRIRAVRQSGQARLLFSDDIPEPARQAFRNVWTPPPASGGGGARARG